MATVDMETLHILGPDGIPVTDREPNLEPERLWHIHTGMLMIRALDDRMLKLQRQGRIAFYGTATGQEATVIGSALALQPQDWVFPALREVGVALMRGYRLEDLVHQLLGNRKDLLKGRQMPCHYSDRRVNHVAWSSCIGTQLPQAVGAAMAAHYSRDPVVVMAYLGDGATSESDFHVAMNFAGVFRAPVVFLCQNNHWSISVPLSRQTAAPSIAIKARAYGFPGMRVDGNDPLAVYAATQEAVDRARRGGGPTLIEAVTYRIGAHSTSDDPTRYRDPEEVRRWQERDPIERFRRYLKYKGIYDEQAELAFIQEFDERLMQCVRVAETEPPPSWETLFEDVYATLLPHLEEQKQEHGAYLATRNRWT